MARKMVEDAAKREGKKKIDADFAKEVRRGHGL